MFMGIKDSGGCLQVWGELTKRAAHSWRNVVCTPRASQCLLHNGPILRLLSKVAAIGAHRCDFLNSCGGFCPQRALLEEARKLTSSREILLWMTPSEAPKALQASECSELLDPMRASCWIFAQH